MDKKEAIKRVEKQQFYLKTINKVIVTYRDNSKKEFTANNWFLFEDGIRKIAKNIEVININK